VTHPTHSEDCEHHGRCSRVLGCLDELGRPGDLSVTWARTLVERGGRWYARAWQSPRGPYHLTAEGEEVPVDGAPKWARR
jgi:hypothetical protein